MAVKDIINSNTAGIVEASEHLKVLGDRDGKFVWKQLTGAGGDFVAFVTADDENSYPNKGTQDGYYYVKFDPLTAIAENIREGVSIFDIIGTMSEGMNPAQMFGFTKWAVDEIVFSSDITQPKLYNSNNGKKLAHSLGEKPVYAMIIGDANDGKTGTIFYHGFFTSSYGAVSGIEKTLYTYYNTDGERMIMTGDPSAYGFLNAATASTVTLTTNSAGSGVRLPKGRKYYLITGA